MIKLNEIYVGNENDAKFVINKLGLAELGDVVAYKNDGWSKDINSYLVSHILCELIYTQENTHIEIDFSTRKEMREYCKEHGLYGSDLGEGNENRWVAYINIMKDCNKLFYLVANKINIKKRKPILVSVTNDSFDKKLLTVVEKHRGYDL